MIIKLQVGVDTAKVRVSRSAKEEKADKEVEVTEETNVVDEKETIPVLKPSIKADESDAVNAIQVAANHLSCSLTNISFKVEPKKELTEEAEKAEEIEVGTFADVTINVFNWAMIFFINKMIIIIISLVLLTGDQTKLCGGG